MQGVTPNGGNRAIQSHATWSNSNIYLDIGGCCAGTSSRLNGVLEDQHIRASEGETWSHITYTAGIDPDTEEYTRRIYVNGEIYGFGGDPAALAQTTTDGAPLLEGEKVPGPSSGLSGTGVRTTTRATSGKVGWTMSLSRTML